MYCHLSRTTRIIKNYLELGQIILNYLKLCSRCNLHHFVSFPLCVYNYVYAYVCVYICVCVYVHMLMYVCMYMDVCLWGCTCLFIISSSSSSFLLSSRLTRYQSLIVSDRRTKHGYMDRAAEKEKRKKKRTEGKWWERKTRQDEKRKGKKIKKVILNIWLKIDVWLTRTTTDKQYVLNVSTSIIGCVRVCTVPVKCELWNCKNEWRTPIQKKEEREK